MSEPTDTEKLILLYEENNKVAAIFWEWRHKIITNFFTGIAAFFILAAWFYQQSETHIPPSAPFIVGAVFSFVWIFLDRRNELILKECYAVGSKIEEKILKNEGIFFFISKNRKYSYSMTLRIAFTAVGVLMLIFGSWDLYSRLRK